MVMEGMIAMPLDLCGLIAEYSVAVTLWSRRQFPLLHVNAAGELTIRRPDDELGQGYWCSAMGRKLLHNSDGFVVIVRWASPCVHRSIYVGVGQRPKTRSPSGDVEPHASWSIGSMGCITRTLKYHGNWVGTDIENENTEAPMPSHDTCVCSQFVPSGDPRFRHPPLIENNVACGLEWTVVVHTDIRTGSLSFAINGGTANVLWDGIPNLDRLHPFVSIWPYDDISVRIDPLNS